MRLSARKYNELREIKIIRNYTRHAEGSVLVQFGDTHVLCNATILQGIPRFLKGHNKGWLTAEYGMLPRSTSERTQREAVKGKQSGRTLEIQRLIGRSLRTAIDLTAIPDYTVQIDCDVIQADGGTRTASITGGCVALIDAINQFKKEVRLKKEPIKQLIAAISVGMYKETPVLDLDYLEDSSADTDMNIVMNEKEQFIEIQGTAEKTPFKSFDLNGMLKLANQGIRELIIKQKQALED